LKNVREINNEEIAIIMSSPTKFSFSKSPRTHRLLWRWQILFSLKFTALERERRRSAEEFFALIHFLNAAWLPPSFSKLV